VTATFGWPAILHMALAAKFCGRHRSTLQRAVRAGELVPAGRNGKSLTFRTEDLSRWMCGETTAGAPLSAPKSVNAAVTRTGSANTNALERLRAIAKGTP